MKKITSIIIAAFVFASVAQAQTRQAADTTSTARSLSLDEVVVTGSRVPIQRSLIPVPISVVGRTTLKQSKESNILPVLMKHVPGLFVTSRGILGYGISNGAAGGINMRGFGAGAGRVLILIDGHPQYATIYGHPVADAYLSSNTQRVEVSRGAESVLYGSNAMGGAINIITRQATEDGNNLSASLMGGSYGTMSYSVTDAYRNGRFSGVVSGNYERTDGHRVNSAFESFSGYARLGYDISNNWRATGNVNITQFNSENPGPVTAPILDGTADVLRGMAGLSLENNYDITRGAVNIYYNWGDHELNDGHTAAQNPRPFLFNSTDYMAGVNIYQSVNLFKGNTLTGGFDVKLYGGNAFRNPETEIYADHIKHNEIAGYVSAQQILGRFLLNAGIRMENHDLYGTEWVPQAGVSYRAADHTNLKFSVSKGFRTPNMRELYMFGSANEELMPESSISYDLTLSQGFFNDRLTADLTLYYIDGHNLIEAFPVTPEFSQNRNVGEFTNKGVEVSLNYQILNNLNLITNYSYLDMETPIVGAPRHNLYAGMTYAPSKFVFSAGAQVIDKLYTHTPTRDRNETLTSSYTVIDAQASYQALKWANVFVKADNLTAREYETMLGFPMPRATFMGGINLNF